MICLIIALFLYYLSKILEKLFSERLNSFLQKYGVISNTQYGFKANISISYTLADASNYIKSNYDKSIYNGNIY